MKTFNIQCVLIDNIIIKGQFTNKQINLMSIRNRKNSTDAKQLLLSICNSQQQITLKYLDIYEPRRTLNKFLLSPKPNPKKQPDRQPANCHMNQFTTALSRVQKSFSLLKRRGTLRVLQRCNHSTVVEKSRVRKQVKPIIDIPKVDIGKFKSFLASKRNSKASQSVNNRIRIVIRNCNQMKKDYQRIRTVN